MSDSTLVVIFVSIVLISLACVSSANNRQIRARLIAQRLEQLKRKTVDLEEISVALESLLGNTTATAEMIKEEIELFERMVQLSPKSQLLQLSLTNAKERLQLLADNTSHRTINRQFKSDAAIARAQYCLSEAGRIIQRRSAAGLIESTNQKHIIGEMIWARMMISITSFVGQGHKALSNGSNSKANAYYKKAMDVAHKTPINDERRLEIIRELGDMIQKKRTTLSSHLMPEDQTNQKTQTPTSYNE